MAAPTKAKLTPPTLLPLFADEVVVWLPLLDPVLVAPELLVDAVLLDEAAPVARVMPERVAVAVDRVVEAL